MKFASYFPKSILFFLRIYFIGILFFSIFRTLLFLSEFKKIDETVHLITVFQSFIMGVRFDTVISGYVLILPFFIITILSFLIKIPKVVMSVLFAFLFLCYGITFLICAIDIPYFNYFYSRITIVALQWIETPDIVLKMIFQEPKYWAIIIPLIVIIFLFYKALKLQFKNTLFDVEQVKFSKILFIILSFIFILVGIRGSLEPKSPIHISTAYFSDNSFLNQLGLNPNFTLIRSYIESKKEDNKFITLMDDKTAIKNVRNSLHIISNDPENPFLRVITTNPNLPINNYNVVLIMMESMSVAKMKIGGNKDNLTPFLDSIATKGIYFENAYSSGIHTYNGVFSTLTSYPALFMQHPMRDGKLSNYNSIFSSLRKNGYSTNYFTTHDGFYDNIGGFLKANDCQKVITEIDYPKNEIKTCFGVPDDFMFRFSIPIISNLAKTKKPFFTAFMTTSDHGPYFIPSYFKASAKEIDKQATQYADYSLKKMMSLASKQDWFDNTLFVFVADHGVAKEQTYEMPLSYNHIPIVFYGPKIIKNPKKIDKIASQIDVYPTIMGILNQSYKNNSLGIDLLKEDRPYAFFNGDDKFGVIDNNWFLIVRNDKSEHLYKYRNNDKKDYSLENKIELEKMSLYAKSNLQSYQYFLRNKKIQLE